MNKIIYNDASDLLDKEIKETDRATKELIYAAAVNEFVINGGRNLYFGNSLNGARLPFTKLPESVQDDLMDVLKKYIDNVLINLGK